LISVGNYNTAVGYAATLRITTGNGNAATRVNALISNTTGNRNVAMDKAHIVTTKRAIAILAWVGKRVSQLPAATTS